MAYTGLELFMENLKQLIYDKNPLVRKNLHVLAKRPRLKLIYEGFVDLEPIFSDMKMEEGELEKMRNLKRRLRDVADEAHVIIDLFVSNVVLNYNKSLTKDGTQVFNCSSNLDAVIKEIKSIKEQVMIIDKKTMEPFWSPQPQATVGTLSSTRNSTVLDDIFVGLEDDLMAIVERLVGDGKALDIISIVGMGGLGKTTLATKVYNHSFVVYHFHVRAWITVSQAYTRRDLLIRILESIGQPGVNEIAKLKDEKLRAMLYKCLWSKRYLIVIDDIWSTQAWDDLKLFFANNYNGSRILLTSRLSEVALHAKPGGFTCFLRFLTSTESWELLRRKLFRKDDCPEHLIEIGRRIATKCQGLPLALVVIAGVLEKGEMSKEFWEKVAESVSSYIVRDPNGCLDTLALSYDHLPRHLRDCFLYVGGFPEDYKIPVRALVWRWMAEGFIQESAPKSLEEIAEDYLMDLVDRNLLVVAGIRFNGGIKACRIHDLLRELCLKKATEENFFDKTGISDCDRFSDFTFKQRRLFADYHVLSEFSSHHSAPRIRSVLCFSDRQQLGSETGMRVRSFLLLRVLDIQNIPRADLSEIQILFHLRYLAVWCVDQRIPFSVSYLRSLQTLILRGKFHNHGYFLSELCGSNPDDMVNLRHLWSERGILLPPTSNFHVLCNLQSISTLRLYGEAKRLLKYLPNIKKLGCSPSGRRAPLFVLLTRLEILNVQIEDGVHLLSPIRFPATLKELTLKGCNLSGDQMFSIQCLPNLEVLKLLRDSSYTSFNRWIMGEEEFRQLKFLKLQGLSIGLWDASSVNFPCLRVLVVKDCLNLEAIPSGIGDISSLESIEIDDKSISVEDSVDRIREEQHARGNYELKIRVDRHRHYKSYDIFFEGNPFVD